MKEGPAGVRAVTGGLRSLRQPPEAALEPRGLAAHADAACGAEPVEVELARGGRGGKRREQECDSNG